MVLSNLTRKFNRLRLWQKVLVLLVVVWALNKLFKIFLRQEGFDGGAPGTLKCVMYYVDWCPHCKTAKPEWNKLIKDFGGKTINGKRILITKVDCEENPEIAKAQNIDGYPTFRFDLEGTDLEYTGGRTYGDFKRFIESVVRTDNS